MAHVMRITACCLTALIHSDIGFTQDLPIISRRAIFMTPTLVLHKGTPILATGSPGGSRIITTTLQIILNVIDHDMNLASATAAPRVHHQWMPDEVRVEPGISPDTLDLLEQRGHVIAIREAMGGAQSILKDPQGFYGASDPRKPDSLAAGY